MPGVPTQSKDFYAEQLRSGATGSYEEKYTRGKGLYLDAIEEAIVRSFASDLGSHCAQGKPTILEIGAFTGRITRKLEEFFSEVTIGDVAPELLPASGHPRIAIDLSSPLKVSARYAGVISIGHQVSFSGNIPTAIANISTLLEPGGIGCFDMWNAASQAEVPMTYAIARAAKDEVISICRGNGLEVFRVEYGPIVPFLVPGAGWVIERLVRRKNAAARLYFAAEDMLRCAGVFSGWARDMYFSVKKMQR